MINDRKYNFSPGPSELPEEVLLSVQESLLNWKSSGMSVMELSHRGKHFSEIAETASSNIRDLMQIPDDYEVLFLQGGASMQFAMLALNFLNPENTADYAVTGQWSKKAFEEAGRCAKVNLSCNTSESKFTTIPDTTSWSLSENSTYLHLASNETIAGVQFKEFPKITNLVCDMSSDILSRPVDVSRFAMIYAGAQKNLGPAGVTLVIIKKSFLDKASQDLPQMLAYKTHADTESMYNTPPCFPWYVLGEVLKWLKTKGLNQVFELNRKKAAMLYQAIDESNFYHNPVEPDYRSDMNIPFTLSKPELDSVFLQEAEALGLLNLKGHRSVGGMRASIYNAMPLAGVEKLINFMQEFEKKNA